MNTVKQPTESEIMKALECCSTPGKSCKECPAFVKVDRSECKTFFLAAIQLLKSKNARISDLKSSLKQTRQTVTTFESAYAVGVRECAEMVKTHEKTKIGVSLNVLIISEEEVNEIVETLVHSHKCTAKKEDPDNV